MKKWYKIFVIVVILALATLVFSVSASTEDKIGLMVSVGGRGDASLNDVTYFGARAAADKFGLKLDFVEPGGIADFESILRDFAINGEYVVIIATGFLATEALIEVAAEFPDQKFIMVYGVVEAPNIASTVFRDEECAYLLGVIAGMMTQTNRLAFIGGMDMPIMQKFNLAFEAGARLANPDVVVDHSFVGAFDDPVKGKEHALAHFARGADIIGHAAGKSGLGLLKAAVETDNLAFAFDTCSCHLHPDHIIASAVTGVEIGVTRLVNAILEGRFEPGIHTFGVADGLPGICPLWKDHECGGMVELPAIVKATVIGIRQMIIDGEISVPGVPVE